MIYINIMFDSVWETPNLCQLLFDFDVRSSWASMFEVYGLLKAYGSCKRINVPVVTS